MDESHVHIIPMDGVNKFIYKNGHIQTLVLMRNNHLFIRFEKKKGWTTNVPKTLKCINDSSINLDEVIVLVQV